MVVDLAAEHHLQVMEHHLAGVVVVDLAVEHHLRAMEHHPAGVVVAVDLRQAMEPPRVAVSEVTLTNLYFLNYLI